MTDPIYFSICGIDVFENEYGNRYYLDAQKQKHFLYLMDIIQIEILKSLTSISKLNSTKVEPIKQIYNKKRK